MLGAMAGAWAAVLYLCAAWIFDLLAAPAAGTIVSGMVLGLGLCGLLGPADDLYNQIWHRALKTGLLTACAGMAAGGAAFALIWLLSTALGAEAAQWIFLPIFLGICGGVRCACS